MTDFHRPELNDSRDNHLDDRAVDAEQRDDLALDTARDDAGYATPDAKLR